MRVGVADSAGEVGNAELVGKANYMAVSIEHEAVGLVDIQSVEVYILSEDRQLEDSAIIKGDGLVDVADPADNARGGAVGVDIVGIANVQNYDILHVVDVRHISHDKVVGNSSAADNLSLVDVGVYAEVRLVVVVSHTNVILGVIVSGVVNEDVFVGLRAVAGAVTGSGLAAGLQVAIGLLTVSYIIAGVSGGLGEVMSVNANVFLAINEPDADSVLEQVDASVSLYSEGFRFFAPTVGLIVYVVENSGIITHALVALDYTFDVIKLEDLFAQGITGTVSPLIAPDTVDVVIAISGVGYLANTGEGIKGIEHSLFTAEGGMVSGGGVTVEEADFVADTSGVEGPGSAFEFVVGVEANSGEEHFGPLITSEGTFGVEGSIGNAVDNALLFAEGDVAGSPVVGSDVIEGSVGSYAGLSAVDAEDHSSNDLSGLGAGVGSLGDYGSFGHTVNDTESGQDAYGLEVSIADFVGISVVIKGVVCGSANHTEAEKHDECKHERQRLLESSHVKLLL